MQGLTVINGGGQPISEPDWSSIYSDEFDIAPHAGWYQATVAVARAMYHQRSGIELGPPFTAVDRARSFHPADGRVVLRSNQTLLEDANGYGPGDRMFVLRKHQ